MSPELENKLIENFPFLFRDAAAPPTESLMCFGCACGDGWFDLIEETCKKITENDPDNTVIFVQIKEKFGQLRIYFNGGPEEIHKIVGEAERRSAHICENCGTTNSVKPCGTWIKNLCPTCTENRYK
jgi:hypothetical protein